MNPRQLEYFLAVARHGSMTRAAEELHVAQPSLSQALRSLERELRIELFHRPGRRLSISPAGRALIGPAKQVLRDLRAARENVEAVRGLVAGSIDIATLTPLARDPLAPIVGRFRQDHPGITIRLVGTENALRVAELVETGECEIGFTQLPLVAGALQVVHVMRQQMRLVLPPGTETRSDPVGAEELATLPWVAVEAGTVARSLVEGLLATVGVTPRVAVECPDRESIMALVLAGAGVTLLPEAVAQRAAEQGAAVRATTPVLARDIAAIWSPQSTATASTAFIMACFGKLGVSLDHSFTPA